MTCVRHVRASNTNDAVQDASTLRSDVRSSRYRVSTVRDSPVFWCASSGVQSRAELPQWSGSDSARTTPTMSATLPPDGSAYSRAALIVFLRLPEAGRCKSRLAAGVGAEGAADFYRACCQLTLTRIARCAGGRSSDARTHARTHLRCTHPILPTAILQTSASTMQCSSRVPLVHQNDESQRICLTTVRLPRPSPVHLRSHLAMFRSHDDVMHVRAPQCCP